MKTRGTQVNKFGSNFGTCKSPVSLNPVPEYNSCSKIQELSRWTVSGIILSRYYQPSFHDLIKLARATVEEPPSLIVAFASASFSLVHFLSDSPVSESINSLTRLSTSSAVTTVF
ncbi:unnamed protein product [Fraxinus pennsylvanica]|uniref:Uncharacterized protein n=1 Tax=Fraxinus pennsylvanica TaxID=56036 RepID=A0AAD1ZC38_9LAMI|nr:unnamed protein product [Fraxinus pennsylvanica]